MKCPMECPRFPDTWLEATMVVREESGSLHLDPRSSGVALWSSPGCVRSRAAPAQAHLRDRPGQRRGVAASADGAARS